MKILVGIKGPGRQQHLHHRLVVQSSDSVVLETSKGRHSVIAANSILSFQSTKEGLLQIKGVNTGVSEACIRTKNGKGHIKLELWESGSTTPSYAGNYIGDLVIRSVGEKLLPVLETDLESYVRGVLHSEVPASYGIEALKSQAILARTYGLHPRIDHSNDHYQVCDSYMCCQAFNGISSSLSHEQMKAISDTAGQILTYQDKPILALFSACAGGCTEDYANCFSDPKTNQFPAPEIPYLKSVQEGTLPAGFPDEKALRTLYKVPHPDTIDAWSPNFRWQATFSADALEAHMHHEIDKMTKDPQFAPFIQAADSGKFGLIKSFRVSKRGPSGTAMELVINTSEGDWTIRKELAIRSIFSNPELKIKRLRSAKIYFDHAYDKLGLLSQLRVYGFGSGHGVGLQQTGAQGLALRGWRCEQILARYYPNTILKVIH